MNTVKFLKNETKKNDKEESKDFGQFVKVTYKVDGAEKNFLEIEVRASAGHLSDMGNLIEKIKEAMSWVSKTF